MLGDRPRKMKNKTHGIAVPSSLINWRLQVTPNTTSVSKLKELMTLYCKTGDAWTKLLTDRMPYSARDLLAAFIKLQFKKKVKNYFPWNLAFHFDIHVYSFLTHILQAFIIMCIRSSHTYLAVFDIHVYSFLTHILQSLIFMCIRSSHTSCIPLWYSCVFVPHIHLAVFDIHVYSFLTLFAIFDIHVYSFLTHFLQFLIFTCIRSSHTFCNIWYSCVFVPHTHLAVFYIHVYSFLTHILQYLIFTCIRSSHTFLRFL